MGWENIFHCEYDPFCQKVLNHHFPNSKLYEDIKTFDASDYFGRIDILSGGFPCQPFSNAGLRKGTEDDRHLWPQMLRIIREVSPRYVVGENVRGLLNWSGGLVFEQVCADLENEGYEVTPYLLPAAGKNAPHRRDRIWFVAYRNEPSTGTDVRGMSGSSEEIRGRKESFVSGSLCSDGDAPDCLEHCEFTTGEE
jgi:DNA (cytosine-5)-methyltransferase 1